MGRDGGTGREGSATCPWILHQVVLHQLDRILYLHRPVALDPLYCSFRQLGDKLLQHHKVPTVFSLSTFQYSLARSSINGKAQTHTYVFCSGAVQLCIDPVSSLSYPRCSLKNTPSLIIRRCTLIKFWNVDKQQSSNNFRY